MGVAFVYLGRGKMDYFCRIERIFYFSCQMIAICFRLFFFNVMSLFDLTVDPPLQPRCSAPGLVKQYLEDNSLGPPRAGADVPQRMVVTLLGVQDAEITWSSMALINNGPKSR